MNKNAVQQLIHRLHFGFFRRVPLILQTEVAECGLACLAMICGWHGFHTDLNSLRQLSGVSSRGATLRTLMNTAEVVHLKSRAVELDLEDLPALTCPCILHWDMNHFVVLLSARRGRVVIHDPALGRRVMGMREVSQHFTGVALELWPDGEFTAKKQLRRLSLRTLTKHISGLKGTLIKIACLALLIESVNLLLPAGMQLVMDHVIPAQDSDLLLLICLSLLFLIIFRTVMSALRGWISMVMSTLIDIQWKARLFDHLMGLPLPWFEKRKLGDVQSRFASLDTLRTTLTTNVVNSLMDGMMVVGLTVMMVLYGGWLVWVVIGFTLIYSLFRFFTYSRYRQISEEQLVKTARSGSHFMETLYGVGTLKALGLATTRSHHWLNLNIDAANAGVRKTKFEMLFTGGSTLIASLDQILLLWLGATQVMDGHMTLGMFVAFNTYRGDFSERMSNLLNMVLQLRMLTLHAERISDIALSETESTQPDRPLLGPGEPAELSVRNLTFQYDPFSAPIFIDLSFTISPGESLAITGPSGKGKTTLMKIMAGLQPPTVGEVRFNGLDISQSGINNYRACIACVLQDDTLFAGTIADNIAGFDGQREDERVYECARLSHIHDEIIRMQMGYNTLVSELGGSLSGGQKQRLLIARALYRRPSILFMDEATSHLDEDNEARINEAIRSMNITRVIIAHRPSTIASADRVMPLV